MTIIDLKLEMLKKKDRDFHKNLKALTNFCSSALDIFTSQDVLIAAKNKKGEEQLDKLIHACKIFSEINKDGK